MDKNARCVARHVKSLVKEELKSLHWLKLSSRMFRPVQDAMKHLHFLSLLKKATVVAERPR